MIRTTAIKKTIILALCIVLCIALWFYRYISFNADIAKTYTPKRTYYSMNEPVAYDDNIINLHAYKDCYTCVTKAQIVNYQDFCAQFGFDEADELSGAAEDSKICLIEISFSNCGEIAKEFEVGDLLLYGKDKVFYLSPFIANINPELNLKETSAVNIEAGSSKSILMPYVLNSDSFSNKDWSTIEDYTLYLFVTQFPEERIVCIDYT